MVTLVALVAAALAAQVVVSLDPQTLREGQSATLQIEVRDAEVTVPPTLQTPEGLALVYRGVRQGAQIINFDRAILTTFTYEVMANRRGSYTLGPWSVPTSAGPVRTAPVTLTVDPRLDGGAALRGSLSAMEAWVGQVLVYTMRFETEQSLLSGRWVPPEAPGLTPEASVEPSNTEGQVEREGRVLTVQELQYPLRAVAAGRHRLPGGVLAAQFPSSRGRTRSRAFPAMPFGDVRTENFAAEPTDVVVKALPSQGRPADFSGLVGNFTVSAVASPSRVAVGETVTLEVVVEGDGPLAGLALPPVDAPAFRVYDDQPTVAARLVDGAYRAKATFKRALVPQEGGTHTVAAVALSVFDPSSGRYARVETEPVTIEVDGAAQAPSPISFAPQGTRGDATVDALGEDILPIRTAVRVSAPIPRAWAWLLVVPGAALLLGRAAAHLRQSRAATAPVVEERVSLDDLPGDAEARLAALERALRVRIGGRLGLAPDAVRREDLGRLGAHADAAETAWRALEAARYGGAANLPEEAVRRVVEALA